MLSKHIDFFIIFIFLFIFSKVWYSSCFISLFLFSFGHWILHLRFFHRLLRVIPMITSQFFKMFNSCFSDNLLCCILFFIIVLWHLTWCFWLRRKQIVFISHMINTVISHLLAFLLNSTKILFNSISCNKAKICSILVVELSYLLWNLLYLLI